MQIRLKELRKQAGVTQAEIAEYLQISREAYSMYESNKRQMNYETLALIAKYHKVSIDYILGQRDAIDILSNEETTIIRQYRKLDFRGKENVKAVIGHEISVLPAAPPIRKSVM